MSTYKSVADVIQEIEYWLRLSTFLHEPLKNALLHVLHNVSNDPTYTGLPEAPYLLYQELDKQRNRIQKLVRKRVLQQDQVDLLLPPNDNKTDSSSFDVTLIVILIINFTTLPPPLTGWKDKNPLPNDRSKGAGVIRAREWRNFVHHTEPKDIDKTKFNKKWVEGTQIITDLRYHYNSSRLKTISLDPKHELVLQSLFSFMAQLQSKHNSLDAKHDSLEARHDVLETKHDTLISSLTQQCNKISSEVQHLQLKTDKNDYTKSETSSRCLKKVLEYISKEMTEEEAKELIDQLNIDGGGDLVGTLKTIPWENIKKELEMLGRKDIVEHIQRNTLITRGLKNASDKLRDHYLIELIDCLVEQPLASMEMDNYYIPREDVYVDLVVLPSSAVDEEWSNSDRDSLMKQNLLDKSSAKNAVDKLITPQDELIFIRGVAGIGKSTLIDMFTFKWAKMELDKYSMFDFVFKFTCRELNQILNEFDTLEQLLKMQYPDIFCNVTLEDLTELSDRVLIIVDGLDELKDIYQMDRTSVGQQAVFLKVIYDMMHPNNLKSLKNHKTIVCGRPKACEFLKNQFSTCKMKTIEVCGFNHANVEKYIRKFFNEDNERAKTVKDTIESSHNLKVMSTVPVFLWVICNVYNENLIKSSINTNTELYFYTCLVLLRNHFQGTSKRYKNLLDIINDQVIVHVVYSLMVLSVKTYMQNQVIFTDSDIKKLKCPVHLEQTGFIVKYSRSNTAQSIFQFRHLILQEFLCGMYLCVTKGVSPFLSNRELSSCLPTVLGIHRIVQKEENNIFLKFYQALLSINDKMSSFFVKLGASFRNSSYDSFIKENIQTLTLPRSMVKDGKLLITDSPDCQEFLNLFKESGFEAEIDAPPMPSSRFVRIQIDAFRNLGNILKFLEKLKISRVHDLYIKFVGDEESIFNEDIMRLYSMTTGEGMKTVITLRVSQHPFYRNTDTNYIHCSHVKLRICLYSRFTSALHIVPDFIKINTDTFYFGIEEYTYDYKKDQFSAVIQDVTKYAIDHSKNIYLSWLPDQKDQLDGLKPSLDFSLFQDILEQVHIDVRNKYVHIIDFAEFENNVL